MYTVLLCHRLNYKLESCLNNIQHNSLYIYIYIIIYNLLRNPKKSIVLAIMFVNNGYFILVSLIGEFARKELFIFVQWIIHNFHNVDNSNIDYCLTIF